MVQAQEFYLPMGNRDFTDVRIGIKGLASTAEDMVSIDKVSNVSAKLNPETSENDYYDAIGKTTRKNAVSPSVDVTFTFSGSAVHKYILEAGFKTKNEGVTQVECDMPDGNVLSMIANIQLDNFAADGAPGDDAEFTVSFTYALGKIKVEPKETTGE